MSLLPWATLLVDLLKSVPFLLLVAFLLYRKRLNALLRAVTRRIAEGPVEVEALGTIIRIPRVPEKPDDGSPKSLESPEGNTP
jgi:hypothetical protein